MSRTYEVTVKFDVDVEVSDAVTSFAKEAGIKEEIRYQVIKRMSEWVKRWRIGQRAFDEVEIDVRPKDE